MLYVGSHLPPILKHEASPVSGLCVFLFVLPPSCAIPWNTQFCPSLLPWLPKSSHPERTYFLRLRPDSPTASSRGCPAFLCKSLGPQPEIVPSQLRPTFQSLHSFQYNSILILALPSKLEIRFIIRTPRQFLHLSDPSRFCLPCGYWSSPQICEAPPSPQICKALAHIRSSSCSLFSRHEVAPFARAS